jgi:dephospho-CoA kinase
VFRDPAARARLEAIVHPRIRELYSAEVARLHEEGHPFAVYDVPLLYEKHLEREVDLAVVVWTPRAVQHERLVRRDGLTPAEAESRLAAQLPLDEKAERADVVVLNDGDPSHLADKAARLVDDLRRGRARRLSNGAPTRY